MTTESEGFKISGQETAAYYERLEQIVDDLLLALEQLRGIRNNSLAWGFQFNRNSGETDETYKVVSAKVDREIEMVNRAVLRLRTLEEGMKKAEQIRRG